MFKSKKLASWNDVDTAMRELGELQMQVQGVNNKFTPQVNDLKATQNAELEPLQARINALEAQIQTYCQENKAEFAETRTKKLTFGTVSARLVEKFDFPKTKDKLKDLLETLKTIGRSDCIKKEEAPDKAKIKELDGDTLAKLGLKLEKADNFTIKPSGAT